MSLKLTRTERITQKTTLGRDVISPSIRNVLSYTDGSYTTRTTLPELGKPNNFEIIGEGFTADANVLLDGSLVTNATVVSDNLIRCNALPSSARKDYLIVETQNGTATWYQGYQANAYPRWQRATTANGGPNTTLTLSSVGDGEYLVGNIYSFAATNLSTSGVNVVTIDLFTNPSAEGNLTARLEGSQIYFSDITASGNVANVVMVQMTDAEGQKSELLPISFYDIANAAARTSVDAGNLLLKDSVTLFNHDKSTNPYTLTVNGNTRAAAKNPFTQSYSYYFDGTTYITMADNEAICATGTGDFTLETWIYPIALPTKAGIFDCQSGAGPASKNGFGFYTATGGTIGFSIQDGASSNTNGTGMTANTWHHLVLQRKDGNFQIYRDGNYFEANTAFAASNVNPNTIVIGKSYDGFQFHGYMSDLRFVSGEAMYLANVNFDPTNRAKTVTDNTTLLTCRSTSVRNVANTSTVMTPTGNIAFPDNSPILYNTSLPNGVSESFSETDLYYHAGSAFFDGSGDYIDVNDNAVSANDPFSLEAYVYQTGRTVTAQQMIFSQYTSTSAAGRWYVRFYNNQIQFTTNTGGMITGDLVSLNTWYHILVTRNSSNQFRLFVNGILRGYYSGAMTLDTRNSMIGAIPGNRYFQGYISNMRVVNGSIPDEYVTSSTTLDTAIFTPPNRPLTRTANTNLLTLQTKHTNFNGTAASVKAIDISKNDTVITVAGDARESSFSPYPYAGQANVMYFDGDASWYDNSGRADLLNLVAEDFTIDFWINQTNVLTGGTIFTVAENGAGAIRRGWTIYAGANISMTYSTTSSTLGVAYNQGVAGGLTKSGQWHHIAFVRRNGLSRMFVDGQQAGETASFPTQNGLAVNGNYFGMGGFTGAGSGAFNAGAPNRQYMVGYVSDFRIIKGTCVYWDNFDRPADYTQLQYNTIFSVNNGDGLLVDSGVYKNTFSSLIGRNGFALVEPPAPLWKKARLHDHTKRNSIYISNSTISLSGAVANIEDKSYALELFYYPVTPGTAFTFLGGPQAGDYDFYHNGSSILVQTKDTTTEQISVSSTMIANSWNHIAVTRANGNHSLFVNGTRIATATNSQTYDTAPIANITTTGIGYISNYRLVVSDDTTTTMSGYVPTETRIEIPREPLVSYGSNTKLLFAQELGDNFMRDTSGNDNHPLSYTGNSGVIIGSSFSPFIGPNRFYEDDVQQYLRVQDHGGSWDFDGTSDNLSFTLPSGGFGSGDFTLEYFVYHNSLSDYQSHFGVTRGATGFNVGSDASGDFVFYDSNGGGSRKIESIGAIHVNRWYHWAFVRHNGVITGYLDGRKVATYNSTVNYSGTGCTIGSLENNTEYVNGYISNFRIDIGSARYLTDFTPPFRNDNSLKSQIARGNGLDITTTGGPDTGKFMLDSAPSFGYDAAGEVDLETIGAVTVSQQSPYKSSSVYFDGTDDWLQWSAGAVPATNEFCVEFWVYANSVSTRQTIVTQYLNTTAPGRWYISIAYFGVAGELNWNASSFDIATGSGTVQANTWHHVVLTRTNAASSTCRMFVDGVLVDSSTQSLATSIDSSDTRLGASTNGQNDFNGYISNFRVISGSVPTEYQTTSTTNGTVVFTPPSSPLTAISDTSLLTCQSPTVIDNSANDLAVTVNGDAEITQFTPFDSYYRVISRQKRYSVNFDGSGDYLEMSGTADTVPLTADFTIEWWYKNASTAGQTNQNVIGWTRNGTDYDGFFMQESGSNFRVMGSIGSYVNQYLDGGSARSFADWKHIAVTRESGSLRCFIDGTLVYYNASNWNGTAGAIGQAVRIGRGSNTYPNDLLGRIADFRYSTAVEYQTSSTTAGTEVFTPPTAPLSITENTKYIACRSPVIMDAAGKTRFTTAGNTSVVEDSPYSNTSSSTAVTLNGDNSLYFNGSTSYVQSGYDKTLTLDGSFTIEFWAYFNQINQVSSATVLFANQTLDNFQLYTDTNASTINLQLNGTKVLSGSASVAFTKRWAHIALARNSANEIFLYVDNKLISSNTNSYSVVSTNFYIGGRPLQSPYHWFDGYIKDFRLTKGTSKSPESFGSPLFFDRINETNQFYAIAETGLPSVRGQAYIGYVTRAFETTGGPQFFEVPSGLDFLEIKMWGGGGGGQGTGGTSLGGGSSGYTFANILIGDGNVSVGDNLLIAVGEAGHGPETGGGYGGYPGGGRGGSAASGGIYIGSGGGGLSGVFKNANLSQQDAIAIAGGGGGVVGMSPATSWQSLVLDWGGSGGGETADQGSYGNFNGRNEGGRGATQIAGGSIGGRYDPNNPIPIAGFALGGGYGGTATNGGHGGGGGGGGGWFGGGGGSAGGGSRGSGGGGSGYVGSANVSYVEAYTVTGTNGTSPNATTDSDVANLSLAYTPGNDNSNGLIILKYFGESDTPADLGEAVAESIYDVFSDDFSTNTRADYYFTGNQSQTMTWNAGGYMVINDGDNWQHMFYRVRQDYCRTHPVAGNVEFVIQKTADYPQDNSGFFLITDDDNLANLTVNTTGNPRNRYVVSYQGSAYGNGSATKVINGVSVDTTAQTLKFDDQSAYHSFIIKYNPNFLAFQYDGTEYANLTTTDTTPIYPKAIGHYGGQYAYNITSITVKELE